MDDIRFDTFPGDAIEALALLYVQNQDISGLSPEDLFDKYQEAYDKIREHSRAKRAEMRKGWSF